jgi:hypothetical protein
MNNKEIIQNEIYNKINSNNPYVPNSMSIFEVKTDVNIFPYNRFFRGDRFSSQARIWEREAGWSPLIETIKQDEKINMSLLDQRSCFQIPCSTILPCSGNNRYQASTQSKVYISP